MIEWRAFRDTWVTVLASRLLVWTAGAGTVALFGLGPVRNVIGQEHLTRGYGWLGDALVAPAARWDAGWYLLVAEHGYGPGLGSATAARSVFFPLYPLLVAAFSGPLVGPIGAGVLISVVAFAVALYWLHRLTALEVAWSQTVAGGRGATTSGRATTGRWAAVRGWAATPGWAAVRVVGEGSAVDIPRLTIVAMAFAPMGFFFSAVYSESLFLALSVGVFWHARNGHWARAAMLGALASATRPTGILLLAPVLLLYLYGPRGDRPGDIEPTAEGRWRLPGWARPRYRIGWDVLWLALIPLGVAVFLAYLGLSGGDPASPFSSQQLWGRQFAGPFVGLWDGTVAAARGVVQLASLQGHHSYLPQAAGAPLVAASHDVVLLFFAAGAIVSVVGVLRALPLAYGVYVVLALALPLSYPVAGEPLMSLPRFLLVLFPLGMWMGGWLAAHPRARGPVLALWAVSMVFFTGAFATWHWVS
jgi:hypothetical protein